ncbi:MAG: hypothetical protein RLZZ450_5545 [Pseudomonadota bacterium]
MRRVLASLVLLTGCAGALSDGDPSDPASPEDPWHLASDAGPDATQGGDAAGGPLLGYGDGASDAGFTCASPPVNALAAGLHIRDIAVYQTVKVPLVQNGALVVERVPPIVQRKKALVRVFVDLMPDYTPRGVRGVLALHHAGSTSVAVDLHVMRGASNDGNLGSTFNFEVPAELVGPDTALSISLEEPGCQSGNGLPVDARFPQLGAHPLATTAIERLELVIVPVRLDGRTPSTSESELSIVRTDLIAFYPVPDVKIRIRAPIDAENPLDATQQTSWSLLLGQIERTRAADNPAPNVYYMGVVQPTATRRSYCLGSCVLGLAPLNSHAAPEKQIAVGASFGDGQVSTTIVHELGHAHGRGHAPCVANGSISDTDPSYPDPMGATGTWGWDSRTNEIRYPDDSDVMGYCNPRWISAYTYAAIAERSVRVNRGDERSNPPAAREQRSDTTP